MSGLKFATGALGGTRTPTILLTATSRQRVYQFRHERLGDRPSAVRPGQINGADVTNQLWGYKACERLDSVEIWSEAGLSPVGRARQHPLDFHRDAVAVDQHDAA